MDELVQAIVVDYVADLKQVDGAGFLTNGAVQSVANDGGG